MHSITGLDHINAWIFDLDNTLYPPECALFPIIDERIRKFVSNFLGIGDAEAYVLQKQYFQRYGTTLLGLIENHGIEPRTFLDFVHDINLDRIAPDTRLATALDGLPGKKIVFTNADSSYARRVLERLGVETDVFESIFDIEEAGWIPKPNLQTYVRMIAKTGIDPARAVFFEDLPRNLAPAAELGIATVWVKNDAEWARIAPESQTTADYVIHCLSEWLHEVSKTFRRG